MFNRLKTIECTDRFFRRVPGFYEQALRQFDALENSDPQERAAIQQRRIQTTLARARRLSGYAGAPASDRLEDWPVLTRADVQGREECFATRTLYPSPKAETGGTTGQPLRIKRTISGIAFEQAVIDRLCASVGMDACGARVAMLKADNIDPALTGAGRYWQDIGRNKRIYSSHHICPRTADVYRRSLQDFAPDILFCYPSSVELLAQTLGESTGLRIPLVFTSSDILRPETHDLIRRSFNCDNIDFYGHAERIVAAYNINGSQYRFLPSYGYAELIPCGDGLARIVATTLRRAGQIFVRYDTGDIARIASSDPAYLQQVGLGLVSFDGILGRDNEYIELSDGRRIFMVNTIARGADGASSLQLHFDGTDIIDIYIVPGSSFGEDTCRHVLAGFRQKFPSSVHPRLWTVSARIREANGKAPVLLRNPCLPDDRTAVDIAAIEAACGNSKEAA
jgi:phenylacetate-CoA ligase